MGKSQVDYLLLMFTVQGDLKEGLILNVKQTLMKVDEMPVQEIYTYSYIVKRNKVKVNSF